MIYLICPCGKHLTAPDEAERKGCVCPVCGARLGGSKGPRLRKSAPRGPAPRPEPAAPLLVPQWDEGKGDTRDAPRYRVAAPEEATTPPGRERKPSKSSPPSPLEGIWEQYLLLPFREGKALFFLSLLVTCLLGFLLHLLAASASEEGHEWLFVGAGLVVLALLQCGCWYGVLAALLSGERHLSLWAAQSLGRVFAGAAYSLVCFLAGPAWLLLVAYLFWLHGDDFTWVDWFLLGELVAVAAAYWAFCLLAVAADQGLTGVNPLRVVALVRELGPGTAAPGACLAGAGAVGLGYLAWVSLSELHESAAAWLWLLLTCLAAQVWATYVLLWLGACYSTRPRPQTQRLIGLPPEPPHSSNTM